MKAAVLRILAFLFLPAALGAASFEGKVTMKMTPARGQGQEMVYSLKDGKIRIEMPGQDGMGGMILDPVKKETTIVMDQQKMYMTMSVPDAAPSPGGKAEEVNFEKTGETETILGHTAEKYISTDRDTTTELWLAEGIGGFMMPGNQNPMGRGMGRGRGPSPKSWERALAGKELFPLRVVSRDRSGRETLRMEVTAIEKQSLPDSLFAPPAGYQKFDMGAMMKGMIPGR